MLLEVIIKKQCQCKQSSNISVKESEWLTGVIILEIYFGSYIVRKSFSRNCSGFGFGGSSSNNKLFMWDTFCFIQKILFSAVWSQRSFSVNPSVNCWFLFVEIAGGMPLTWSYSVVCCSSLLTLCCLLKTWTLEVNGNEF